MSLPPFVYHHGIQTIHYLYDLYGYDQLLKEIEVIHHIRQRTVPEVTPVKQEVASVISEEEPIKNIVIQSDKKIHESIELTDETRCTHLVRGGQRCAVRRKKGLDFCHRHIPEEK